MERSTHKRSHIRSIELIQLDSTRYFVVGSSSHGSEVCLFFLFSVFEKCYICSELGGLVDCQNEDYYEVVVFVDVKVKDEEIASLINQLPKFNKSYA